MGRIEDLMERLGFGWAACFFSFIFWVGMAFLQAVLRKTVFL
jgi:hypothetical protein